MRSMDVVLAHNDKKSAQALAGLLHKVFRSVQVVGSVDDLRSAIARNRARLVITDLETIGFKQIEELRREFDVEIVCTHRIPDESMWTKALGLGALDCCHTSDVQAIIQAVNRNMSRSHAA